jgi:Protein of unknown function (DUF3108)
MTDRRRQFCAADLLFLIALTSIPICAEDSAAPAFAPGETLTYNVTWSVFPAGQVVVSLSDAKDAGSEYEVKTTAQSKGFVSLLYNVQDEFHSFFNSETLCSQSISKKVNEGRRHRDTRIQFDYSRKMAVLDEQDPANPKTAPKHDEKPIPDCVQDVVSAFYYVRSKPLEVGRNYELAINDGSETRKVAVEVQAREQIQTGIGMRRAVRVEPKIFGSLYSRKGQMLIWFSDDPQHLPLRIQMTIGIGSITGTLASVTKSGGKDTPDPEAPTSEKP